MKTFRSYCVTHAPALVPQKLVDYTIGLGRYLPDSGASISQLDSYWHERRPVAYGAAGSYAIPRAIEQERDDSELIGICTHRKFVVQMPIGRESAVLRPMREAEAGELAALNREACRPRDPHEFLVPRPLVIGNVVADYDRHHKVIDLLDYLSIAVETGVLATNEVAQFVTQNAIVTGGCELGVYPREWLIATLTKLEKVGRLFLDRHADRVRRHDDYNVRAVAFLSERLGSFFVIKELRRRYPTSVPIDVFGFICCVVEPGSSYAAARVSPEHDQPGP
jgi:hypothetical protein